MKIIFLDIDGVLQPYDNEERFQHDLDETVELVAKKYNDDIYFDMDPYDVAAVYYDWDHKAVKLLKDCLDETNAKIVISSGWREYNNEDKLKALFKIHGMDGYIVDTLPKGLKETVIKDYLDSNSESVESYVVLDDADMSIAFVPQMVRTYNKLTEEDTKEIMDALSRRYAIMVKNNCISISDKGREYGRAVIKLVNVKDNILACIFMECDNIEKKKVELLRTAAISNSLKMNKNITAYLFMADKHAAFAKNASLGGIPLYSPDITANYVYFNIRAYNFYDNNKDLIMKLLNEMAGKR